MLFRILDSEVIYCFCRFIANAKSHLNFQEFPPKLFGTPNALNCEPMGSYYSSICASNSSTYSSHDLCMDGKSILHNIHGWCYIWGVKNRTVNF